jgi:hypothetical protein
MAGDVDAKALFERMGEETYLYALLLLPQSGLFSRKAIDHERERVPITAGFG